MMRPSPFLAAFLIGLVAAACKLATFDASGDLLPVPLPDLSRASAQVGVQLRTRHTELMAAATNNAADEKSRAAAYGELGKLFLAARLFQSAEPALRNAQTLAPDEPRWPYYLGHLQRMTGHPDQAATFFERALEREPNLPAARVWLGRMYLDTGRTDRAAAEFARVVDVPDARFAALVGLGRAALVAGNPNDAVRHLEAALATNPQGASAHYPLATAYRALGDQRQADAHLRVRAAADEDPPDPWLDELFTALDTPLARQRRGVEALNRGMPAEAVNQFRKGLELDPEPVLRLSLMHKLATSLFLMNDADGAIAQLEAGIRTDPNYAPFHFTLGVILASRGELARGADGLTAAVARDPEDAASRVALGNTLLQLGRAGAALPHFAHAITVAPRSADARYGYARALVEVGRTREAHEQLIAGRDAHPDDQRFAEALQ